MPVSASPAAQGSARASPPARAHPGRRVAAAAVLLLAIIAALASDHWPVWTLAGVLTVAAATLAVARLPLAVAVLTASFYFDAYLAVGAGVVTVGKLLGVVALLAWFLAWGVGRRPVWEPLLWPLAGFAAWLPLSLSAAFDQGAGLTVALRYLTFFALVFLVVQTVDGDRPTAVRLVDVAVAAGAVSALVGLSGFLAHGGRAFGPLDDPNDYAFVLAVTVPLALYRVRSAPGPLGRTLAVLAVAVLSAAILATLSRSALVGLAVAGLWATATRRLALGWAALTVAGVLALGLGWYALQPERVATALGEKQHVARSNVDRRVVAWRIALDQVHASPVVGVGPGNFESRFDEFAPPGASGQAALAPHDAYLSVLAELGAPGLALFLVYLALAWGRLRRRHRDPDADALQSALAGGFVVAVVGALFLTEQFYAPLWLLPALGATLARPGRAAGGQGAPLR